MLPILDTIWLGSTIKNWNPRSYQRTQSWWKCFSVSDRNMVTGWWLKLVRLLLFFPFYALHKRINTFEPLSKSFGGSWLWAPTIRVRKLFSFKNLRKCKLPINRVFSRCMCCTVQIFVIVYPANFAKSMYRHLLMGIACVAARHRTNEMK